MSLSFFLPPGAVLENRRTKRARIKFLFFSFFLSGALSYSFPSMEAFCSNFVSFHSGRVGDKSRKAPEPQSVGERIMHKDVSTISFRFPIEYPMTSSRFFFFFFSKNVSGWAQGASGGDGGQSASPRSQRTARDNNWRWSRFRRPVISLPTYWRRRRRSYASALIRRCRHFRRSASAPFLAGYRTPFHGRSKRFSQGI